MNSIVEKVSFVQDIISDGIKSHLASPISYPRFLVDKSTQKILLTKYKKDGVRLLNENKVAVLMVAGGTSNRMGLHGNNLRGNLPIGPVTNRTIFKLQGEKIAAIIKRYSPELQWLVMTSPLVHEQTIESFIKDNYYGIDCDQITFFSQLSFPVLDESLNPVQLLDGSYLESPSGHGGMLDAFNETGILNKLENNGFEYLFYFQYPNVLENVCDPIMLGYHHIEKSDITTKAIREYHPSEKVGRCVDVSGKLQIIEYSLIENKFDYKFLNTLPGNTGTYIWNISFLRTCINNGIKLPFHILNYTSQKTKDLTLRKIEQFVFDLFPFAKKSGLMIVSRDDEFSPVKQINGHYSLNSGKLALAKLYYNWMIKAGGVPQNDFENCIIEISPDFAINYNELESKINPGYKFDNNLIL